MQPAPFHAEIAKGPAGGRAFWARASDGVRVRLAHWPAAPDRPLAGSVLTFPGRSEYVEKYGPVAQALAARGYHMLAIDWRSQGLSDRLGPEPNLGHVGHFNDFQRDADALVDVAQALDLPRPWYLLSHSMGGSIALRALHRGLKVNAAFFSAPMWGILLAPHMRPFAWALSWAGHRNRFRYRYAPTTQAETYVSAQPFDDNMLTTDRGMYAFLQRQAASHPELTIGGPSLGWLYAALCETRALARLSMPALPALTFLGSHERIVDPAPIHAHMARWKQGRLEIIEGAEHELLMEQPQRRERVYDAMDALFAAHR